MKRNVPTTAALIAALACNVAPPVQAGIVQNVIVVSTTNDAFDGFDQQCSLREAIVNAGANTALSPVINECAAGIANGTDVIRLASGATYTLTLQGIGDDAGDLDIVDSADLPAGVPHLRIEVTGGDLQATLSQTAAGERVMENKGAALDLRDVVLRGGTAAAPGGGLYSLNGELWLTRVAMFSNSATSGGGLFNFGPATIVDSSFELNTATAVGGGGIFNAGGDMDLAAVFIRGNSGVDGGGIHSAGGSVFIDGNSVINLNSASGNGGGIANISPSKLTIEDSNFEGNQAGISGGAIVTTSTFNTAIRRSSFVDNQAASGGAVRSITTADLRIAESHFESNTASVDGGAMQAVFAELDNVSFVANKAVGKGGALLVSTSAEAIDTEYTGNEAATGGAVHAQIYTQTGGTFRENLAKAGSGGAVFWSNYVELDQLRFFLNGALENGGALYSSGPGALTSQVSRSEFSSNAASGDGGAIYSRGVLNLSNSTISANGAAGDAGGLYIREGSEVTATHVTIAFNQFGGDLYKYGNLTLRSSIISTPGQADCVALLENPEIISLGNNLSDDLSCEGLDEPSDQRDTDPMLMALGFNQSGTRTHALQPASPAIDAANLGACLADPVLAIDQRGALRPAGNGCDIGAHEQGGELPPLIFADGFESD
jgi:CSLREA domain-containing protein